MIDWQTFPVQYLPHESERPAVEPTPPALLVLPEERTLLEQVQGLLAAVVETPTPTGPRLRFCGLARDAAAAWDAVAYGRLDPLLNPGCRFDGGTAAREGWVPSAPPRADWVLVASIDRLDQPLAVRAAVCTSTIGAV